MSSEVGDEEVVVFEEAEDGEVDDDAQNKAGFSPLPVVFFEIPFYEEAEDVVDGYGEDHQEDVDGFAPAVEYEADDEEDDVSDFQRYYEVDEEGDCQKHQEEFET